MTNARTASVGKNETANLFESSHLTVTLDGSTDLFGAGGDRELALGAQTVLSSLASNGRGTRHILVGRVGARTDESDFKLLGPVVLLDLGSKFGDGSSEIRSEWSVDVRFEFIEVLEGYIRQLY